MPMFKRSPWVIHYDASSCNGCDIEVVASLTPVYDVERLGVINTGNPKHADIFLVTGSVNAQNKAVVENIFEQMPEPKAVVAVGICATSGCVFRECYNVMGGVDMVIPVDVYVPGCAARPESIIDGILRAVGVLDKKRKILRSMRSGFNTMVIQQAAVGDAPEIYALQKVVYNHEAEMYNDYILSPLTQTLQQMTAHFATRVFLKAVVNGKIIGSVRGGREGDTVHLSRLIVHPHFWRRGIGTKLIEAIEAEFPDAPRFETFTGQKSRYTLGPYQSLGYSAFRREKVSEARDRVYLEKLRKAK
jgi:ech hydrogenase subunit C